MTLENFEKLRPLRVLRRDRRQCLGEAEGGEAVAASPRRRPVDRVVEQTIGALQAAGVLDQQGGGAAGTDARHDAARHEHVVGPSTAVLEYAVGLLRACELGAARGKRLCRRVAGGREVREDHRAGNRGQLNAIPEQRFLTAHPRTRLLPHLRAERVVSRECRETQRVDPRDRWYVADGRSFRIALRELSCDGERFARHAFCDRLVQGHCSTGTDIDTTLGMPKRRCATRCATPARLPRWGPRCGRGRRR